MWMLAQIADDYVEMPGPPLHPVEWWSFAVLGMSLTSLLYSAFWLWMLWHCLRTEPDRSTWVWIMLIVPGIGPILYFVVRYLPSSDFRAPKFLGRWTRGRELARLEAASAQIGNPYQFILLGDALREVGRYDESAGAYARALQKEPENLQALWGAAQVAGVKKEHGRIRDLTRQILDKDPRYKFGDVSLAHGKALVDLETKHEAMSHLEQHVRQWRHPEAVYLLATLYAEQGNKQGAKSHLQSVLHDISGSPAAIARKHGRWKSRAKQLLRKLAAS
jgi:hypothetical protein